MELDMFLFRVHKDAVGYINEDIDEIAKGNPVIYDSLSRHIVKRGPEGGYQWDSLLDEVGYWRKANAIHNWFVENVQEGNDDCGYYEVCRDTLEELRNTVQTVLDNSVLIGGIVQSGVANSVEAGSVATMVDGKVILDPSTAQELLPTVSGFFFGGTDYNDGYIDDLNHTMDVINSVLRDTDFHTYTLYYHSSW